MRRVRKAPPYIIRPDFHKHVGPRVLKIGIERFQRPVKEVRCGRFPLGHQVRVGLDIGGLKSVVIEEHSAGLEGEQLLAEFADVGGALAKDDWGEEGGLCAGGEEGREGVQALGGGCGGALVGGHDGGEVDAQLFKRNTKLDQGGEANGCEGGVGVGFVDVHPGGDAVQVGEDGGGGPLGGWMRGVGR